MFQIIFLISILPFLFACQSAPTIASVQSHKDSPSSCRVFLEQLDRERPLEVLNTITQLFEFSCYHEVIQLGQAAQLKYQDKQYSLTAEVTSVFLPDGSNTSYVMESYERAFLSFLVARSYYNLKQFESSEIELRKAYNEQRADIYNFGDDPINLVLLATQWESSSEPFTARSYWRRAAEISEWPELKRWIHSRIEELDQTTNKSKTPWHIYKLGSFPGLDWKFRFSNVTENGYYRLEPLKEHPPICHSETGFILPTSPWLDKMNQRYQTNYHPLLNLKSWIRVPVGLVYGASTLVAGASLGVLGCVLSKGSDQGCRESIRIGGAIAGKSDDVIDYTLAPDLRHWNQVPAAILISKVPLDEEDCYLQQLAQKTALTVYQL
ncbi:MAG: hypothetical protein KDD61_11170 [Bdellovibrionales bacterium]|nr:hypothetical protein [Bdellovibrionales bacterium]